MRRRCRKAPFTTYSDVTNWGNEPTNLMSTLSISFAGTNYQWYHAATARATAELDL